MARYTIKTSILSNYEIMRECSKHFEFSSRYGEKSCFKKKKSKN